MLYLFWGEEEKKFTSPNFYHDIPGPKGPSNAEAAKANVPLDNNCSNQKRPTQQKKISPHIQKTIYSLSQNDFPSIPKASKTIQGLTKLTTPTIPKIPPYNISPLGGPRVIFPIVLTTLIDNHTATGRRFQIVVD